MSLNRPLDHKEYIKLKYLSEPSEEVKEKKLRKKVKVKAATKLSNIRIFDDDIDLQKLNANDDEDELELQYGTNEEKPFVAMVIDERSAELKRKDIDRNTWKPIATHSEPEPSMRPPASSSVSKKSSDPPKRTSTSVDLTCVKKEPGISDDKDLSPPRPGRRKIPDDDDDDLSPPRVSSHREDRDISPPRRHRTSHSPADSPPRRSSKPSRWQRESKSHMKNDSSPPRARRRHDSSGDRSPIRSQRRESSPSSRSSHSKDQRVETRRDDRHRGHTSFHERNRLGLTDEQMGRGAKTVYRDKGTGQKRDIEAEARTKVKPDPEEEELKRKYEKWSKGVKQVENLEERTNEVLKEMDKPLARSADDEDRDKYLRERELEDDPMLKYIRKKKVKEETKKAESEGKVYTVKPKYQGPAAAPNRFAIPPGYRWDGVDRSNGFEKKLLSKNNEKIADAEEAYKWSTEDM